MFPLFYRSNHSTHKKLLHAATHNIFAWCDTSHVATLPAITGLSATTFVNVKQRHKYVHRKQFKTYNRSRRDNVANEASVQLH